MLKSDMTILHKNLLFVLGMLAVLGFFLAISGDRAHQIPDDEDHVWISDILICQECHIPEDKMLITENHPPKFECFKCHKRKKES